ncbi:MAG: hypothetical protein NC548_34700 [Lachnospiraceae bacterium]|nr:hypothetical protein [Lachnospiraceae bacterium]
MFNDEPYGLTEAVLRGTKTQTRRIVPQSHIEAYGKYKTSNKGTSLSIGEFLIKRGYARYTVGEIVAIAQRYKDLGLSPSYVHTKTDHAKKKAEARPIGELPGWNNKMFVAAEFLPHHIKIVGVRVEKLQDISKEDIIAEGVIEIEPGCHYSTAPGKKSADLPARNLRGAYNRLIDGVSKKKIFRLNPYVYVFSFELID